MPPNIEDEHHAAAPDSPFPIKYEDANEKFPNNKSASHDFSPSPSQSIAKEPGHAGPTFLSRLSQLPIQRSLPWRAGQELPPERSSDSERVQQRGASLLATRGNISTEPCTQCAAGRGRFAHCITLGNWFQGACSSCVFTSRGNRCSLRLQRGKVDGRSARHQPVEEGGMNENPRPRKRRRHEPARDPARDPARAPSIANIINDPLIQEHSQDPAAATSSPQTVSQDEDSLLQAGKAGEKQNGLLSYVHNVEEKQKRYQSLPNGFHDVLTPYEPPKDHQMRGYGRFTAVNGTSNRVCAGWQPPQKPPTAIRETIREASRDVALGGVVQSLNDGVQTVPLIDTLPKPKQGQIFGLISGLQGGLDHLQKQLNLLQAALGIELESNGQKAGT